MEWGILLVFFLLLSAILAVLAKVILDDIAAGDTSQRPKTNQFIAFHLSRSHRMFQLVLRQIPCTVDNLQR